MAPDLKPLYPNGRRNPPQPTTGHTMRTNKYGAHCATCSQWVKPQTGSLTRNFGRWVVTHKHDCGADTVATATEPDPVTTMEATHARRERHASSAERAKGRADHFQWEAAWAFEAGRY